MLEGRAKMKWFRKKEVTVPPRDRLQELSDEYHLVNKALRRLHEARGRQIVDGLAPPVIASIKANLIAKRAELELMIDVLND
jgi:hypothetical protein